MSNYNNTVYCTDVVKFEREFGVAEQQGGAAAAAAAGSEEDAECASVTATSPTIHTNLNDTTTVSRTPNRDPTLSDSPCEVACRPRREPAGLNR